jgi:two-component system, OmpR family, sensor kinase
VHTTDRIAMAATTAVAGAAIMDLVRERSVLDGFELALIALTGGLVLAFRRREQDSGRADSPVHAILAQTSLELRTPITIARGHAEILRSADRDENGEDHLDIIVDELDRLTRLTERMHILMSADDPSVIVRRPVTIESVVVDIGRRWGTVAGREWRINCLDETCIVVDAAWVTIALDAMIETALVRTVDGDRIVVSAYAEDGWAVFAVNDTGRCTLSNEVDALGSICASDDDPALTLALRVANTVSRAHGGRLRVERARGYGNELTLHLPIADPATADGLWVAPAAR